ncbi:hypothetical protein ARMGADRAFT_1084637 [Armillaria gallica]|uniref:Uncharacterized protein n=1 Tax=Armillaria gallica TaxID=47427 RepID=A0A2H3CZ29_ARMGA|nr:hypothetical protein ARMGADRAFT_1084637 [Armillaria gallica]
MSDPNPDQDWLARALQNMNQHPLLPSTCDESTTDRNPFRRSNRGMYGLRQTHGTDGRTLSQTRTPTTQPSSTGWIQTSLHSSGSGTYPPRLSAPPPSNYLTYPQNKTLYPPMNALIPVPFPGCIQDHYDQRSAIASSSLR